MKFLCCRYLSFLPQRNSSSINKKLMLRFIFFFFINYLYWFGFNWHLLWLLDLFLLRRNSQCNKSVCLFCDELLKYKQIREFRNAEAVNGFLLHWNQWFWIENIFRNLFIVPVIFNKCCILKLVFNIQYPYKLFGEPSIIYLYLVLRAFAYIGRVKKKRIPP